MFTESTLGRVGCALAGLLLVAAASTPASADLIGDKDCWSLAASCPDGSLWETDLGGAFFSDYRSAGDLATAPFTDIWFTEIAIAYTHTGNPGDSLTLRIAGVADDRGPWDVFGDGVLLGQIPTNVSTNNFEEVLTYSFAVPVALLADNMLDVLLNINVPGGGDGFAIDYSELAAAQVPEPGTLALFGLCLAGLGFARRRRSA